MSARKTVFTLGQLARLAAHAEDVEGAETVGIYVQSTADGDEVLHAEFYDASGPRFPVYSVALSRENRSS